MRRRIRSGREPWRAAANRRRRCGGRLRTRSFTIRGAFTENFFGTSNHSISPMRHSGGRELQQQRTLSCDADRLADLFSVNAGIDHTFSSNVNSVNVANGVARVTEPGDETSLRFALNYHSYRMLWCSPQPMTTTVTAMADALRRSGTRHGGAKQERKRPRHQARLRDAVDHPLMPSVLKQRSTGSAWGLHFTSA